MNVVGPGTMNGIYKMDTTISDFYLDCRKYFLTCSHCAITLILISKVYISTDDRRPLLSSLSRIFCILVKGHDHILFAILFLSYSMHFPLSQLPLELALEILQLAAFPGIDHHDQRIYKTASSLALVSHSIRRYAMPHLLHTVILSTQAHVSLFIRTIQQQIHFANIGSSLELNYPHHIRRLWSTQCWEPLVHQSTHHTNYNILYPIFAGTKSMGFNFDSLHLLYEVLGGLYSDSLPHWQCQRITFAGTSPIWNPITSTTAGLFFLRKLTHLTIWIPNHEADSSASDSSPHLIPDWIPRVPLELMPNLIHFAFSLVYNPGSSVATILTYTLPAVAYPNRNASIFRSWATSDEPLSYGVTSYVSVTGISATQVWEMAYLRGEDLDIGSGNHIHSFDSKQHDCEHVSFEF